MRDCQSAWELEQRAGHAVRLQNSSGLAEAKFAKDKAAASGRSPKWLASAADCAGEPGSRLRLELHVFDVRGNGPLIAEII
jgi:hypothetical protein